MFFMIIVFFFIIVLVVNCLVGGGEILNESDWMLIGIVYNLNLLERCNMFMR